MFPCRILLPCTVLLLALGADAGQGQPAAGDRYGDPLPPGAVARLGTVRFRHDNPVVFATFLPDGKRVLSVSDDGVVCAWEFPSGKLVRRFAALADAAAQVTSASLSPDGKHLTAFCDDGFLRVLDWANSKELGKVAHRQGIARPTSALARSLARAGVANESPVYSPDNKTLLLAGSARVLRFVNLPAGKEIGPDLGHAYPLTSVHFTPDGGRIVTRDTNEATHTWDRVGKELRAAAAVKLPALPGDRTILSPDGRFGVSVARLTAAKARAARTREAVLFETASGKELGRIEIEGEIIAAVHLRPIVFSPDSKLLALNTGEATEKIALYEVPGGKLLRTLDAGPIARPGRGGFGKGGLGNGGMAPGGGGFGGKGQGKAPGAGGRGGKGIQAPGGPGFGGPGRFGRLATQSLFFSPDGKALAFQAGSGTALVVLDTTTGKQVASLTPHVGSLALQGAFAPDGRCLALEKGDGTVTLYELASGQPRGTYGSPQPLTPSSRAVTRAELLAGLAGMEKSGPRFALSPDSRLLALAGPGGVVHVWDVLTGKELAALKGHTRPVNALAFAPDGKTLASASDDTTALIWDVTQIARPAPPAGAPQPGDLEAWWQALADNDAAKAFAALGAFAAVPKDAVGWIKERVKPAPPLDPARTRDLMVQLNDGRYKVRDRATAELLKVGEALLPVLDRALAGSPLPEARRRLEELRTKLTEGGLHGEQLRLVRAVEVLERIGTPKARQVLRALAGGAPGALITASAQAALKR